MYVATSLSREGVSLAHHGSLPSSHPHCANKGCKRWCVSPAGLLLCTFRKFDECGLPAGAHPFVFIHDVLELPCVATCTRHEMRTRRAWSTRDSAHQAAE